LFRRSLTRFSTLRPRSVDHRVLSSAEAILLASPKPQRFVTARATRKFDRMLQLPREPLREAREPLDTEALVETLRLNRSVLEASLDEMAGLAFEGPKAVPPKKAKTRLLMHPPPPFDDVTRASEDVTLFSEAIPLFPRQYSDVELAVNASRDRIARSVMSHHSDVAPFAKRGGPIVIGSKKAFSKPKKSQLGSKP
jgi:hypothetical protein